MADAQSTTKGYMGGGGEGGEPKQITVSAVGYIVMYFKWLQDFTGNTMCHSAPDTGILRHSNCGPIFGNYPPYSPIGSMFLEFKVMCLLLFMIVHIFVLFLLDWKITNCCKGGNWRPQTFSEDLLWIVTVTGSLGHLYFNEFFAW